MLKYLCLTTALIPLTAQAAFSSMPSNVSTSPNLESDNSTCYMQTTDGRTVNLSNLCGKATVQPTVCPEITDPKRLALFTEYYQNDTQALANLGCNAPPLPKYLPEDGSPRG